MEYVEGQPITVASENHNYSIRKRIELVRSLCSAVHHAHKKLVIHRDIKPSNVLVTPEGIVKLIDFGISKPLGPQLIPGEMPATEGWLHFMTPDYASPEQLSGQEVTPASDIYSLGVLLYELLTGTRPYTLRNLSSGAVERLVCEQEIRKPSSVPGLPAPIRKELAGDLDRIVLMAMEKDPPRRYRSALDMEEDLVRFLRGRPVLATKSTSLYRNRMSNFVQRHRAASVMAGASSAVLAGWSLFYLKQCRNADRRIRRAEETANSAILELRKTQQLFHHKMIETDGRLRHS
jgi:serine/threonine protein kinase